MDQYWNAYSYCGADPVNTVDEWGLEGDDNGDDDGDGTPNQNDQDQNPGYDSYHGGTFYATTPNADVSNSVPSGPSGPGSPGSPNGPSGPGFDPNWLKKSFERQQDDYKKEGVEADPFIPSMMLGSLSFKAGKNIVKAGDDVVEDVFNAGKNFADDLTKVRKGDPRKNITEKPNVGKNANGPKSEMLGKNGARTASKTMWKGKGKSRIDVENHDPGKRPGNVHVHDVDNKKYYYDPGNKTFLDAPKHINDLLKNSEFQRGIEKALNVLGR